MNLSSIPSAATPGATTKLRTGSGTDGAPSHILPFLLLSMRSDHCSGLAHSSTSSAESGAHPQAATSLGSGCSGVASRSIGSCK
eukprot:CAMPEP_0178425118 /NCGR_PEP_ID=MMETSP0689_2-20121128/28558_1 /TAXON_ID=160604 /ORGANISM="Amphidinium massartii, Strain CS-259" /LENGTH=83 /DNA_ID=CAMNT_0020046771 /DNA_START=176 /DNA_END=427 /DNA_ORIENTATION=-